MIHSVFSIYDEKAEAFLPPFILPKTEMAQRVFGDCINSADHQFSKHPSDYTLFHMGNFDDEKGEFIRHPNTKQSLGNGVEYVVINTASPKPENLNGSQSLSDETPVFSGPEGDHPA